MSHVRTPVQSDFTSEFDDQLTFNFFEEQNGNGLYALGTISDEEFLRQANLHDSLTDDDHHPWTHEHIERFHAVMVDEEERAGAPFFTVREVPEGTPLAAEVVVLSR